jgi:tetratricopeptide (TPR) repeat protein
MFRRALTTCSIVVLLVTQALSADDPPEYRLAVQLVQEQRWAEALDHIQNLRKQYPGNPKVGNLEGLVLLGRGDSGGAAAAFERVLVAHPGFFPAIKNLAILEWETKNRRAAEHTVQALKMEPKDPVLNVYGALSALEQKNASAANRHLDLAGNAISAMPPQLEMRLAYLLGTTSSYARAAHVYEDIVAHGARGPTLTYNLGSPNIWRVITKAQSILSRSRGRKGNPGMYDARPFLARKPRGKVASLYTSAGNLP